MDASQADLREYYESEARLRLRRPPQGRRAELRDGFIDLLARERRVSVLDVGAGPAHEGEAFRRAGHRYVGVDLAFANARLAAEAQLRVIQASMTALPFSSASFDAGWCLSTLMHLEEAAASTAIDEMLRALRATAPLVIGMWGRESEASVVETGKIPGSRRHFHLRSFERNRRLVTTLGQLEAATRWEGASRDQDYQIFRVRRP